MVSCAECGHPKCANRGINGVGIYLAIRAELDSGKRIERMSTVDFDLVGCKFRFQEHHHLVNFVWFHCDPGSPYHTAAWWAFKDESRPTGFHRSNENREMLP